MTEKFTKEELDEIDKISDKILDENIEEFHHILQTFFSKIYDLLSNEDIDKASKGLLYLRIIQNLFGLEIGYLIYTFSRENNNKNKLFDEIILVIKSHLENMEKQGEE